VTILGATKATSQLKLRENWKIRTALRAPMAEGCAAEVPHWPGLCAGKAEKMEPIRGILPAAAEPKAERMTSTATLAEAAALSGFLFVLLAVVVFCVITFRYHVHRPPSAGVCV